MFVQLTFGNEEIIFLDDLAFETTEEFFEMINRYGLQQRIAVYFVKQYLFFVAKQRG